MITAKAISHTDVHGKSLFYIKCTAGEHTHYINVGEKTYQSIKELEKVTELPLAEPENKEEKEPEKVTELPLPEPEKKEEAKHEVKPKK